MNNFKITYLFIPAFAFLVACTEEDCKNGVTTDANGNLVCKAPDTKPKPKPGEGEETDPNPEPTEPGTPAPENPPSAEFDVFRDIAAPVGQSTDNYYSRYRQLLVRRIDQGYRVDSCVPGMSEQDTFADSIAAAVNIGMRAAKSQISYISSYYGLPASVSSFADTGLAQHPQCIVSAASLNKTLKGRNVPAAGTIAKMNSFARKVNAYREAAIRGDKAALFDMQKLWTRMMMCLAYVESLPTADSATSYRVADAQGVKKPAGVEYYLDGLQSSPDSVLNIGLYQFSPVAGGNVQACLRAWNARVPGCALSTTSTKAQMMDILGSSKQAFNAFCGVTKVVDMFSVQVNTRNVASTHPDNVAANGGLKAAADRCVSPFFNVSAAYNHFGPFQNTINNNLDTLMTCTLAE